MRVRSAVTGALALILALWGPISTATAGPPSLQLVEWQLKNGLRVIFSPHHRIPVVTVQLWYHAGSKDEARGQRGIAHMFEHMMFKGSKRVAPEAHAQLLAAIGGYSNAFTTQDVTAYHNTVPKQYAAFALELEADRMRNLRITPKTMESERNVVKEEKRLRVDNSPVGRALEAIHALAYQRHPYAWTPAGDIPELERTDEQTYRRFYDRYYRPNNALLIVVGDLDEAAARQLVEKTFADVPAGQTPPRVSVREAPQHGLRTKTADWSSQLNIAIGAYHTPAARHADIVPLKVLSAILSAGRSSRLHRSLVRQQHLALGAGGFVYELEHPGLFFVYAFGLPKHPLQKAKDALLAEVERFATSPVSAEELRKAKNQLATGHVSSFATVEGIANEIGESALLHGDPRAFLKTANAIDTVTAADIQRVAKRYLSREQLTLLLVPARTGDAPSHAKKGQAQ